MNKYVDTTAVVNVIGNIYNDVGLLDNENYRFNEEDFPLDFHRLLFGTIYNLHALGAKEINLTAIEDYLEQRPKKYAIYQQNKGAEYLTKLSESVQFATFQYYYDRMKKMTLLRMYNDACGMDLSWLYDPDNILDTKKKAAQEDWFDNTPIEKIADIIDSKITNIRIKCVDADINQIVHAGENVKDLIQSFKDNPEIGYPLFGRYMNTVTRGARLKKFYLRSAATGVGKSRSMIADVCNIGCEYMWSLEENTWVQTGIAEPTMYINTEMDLSEIQTMMIAFLSAVDEEHILNGTYEDGEWARVCQAMKILDEGKVYFEALPDFSLQDIENTIKRGIRELGVKYVFVDYMHTSMKILEEITKRSGGVKLREDNILYMMSVKFKDICNQYGVFIMSATQLNGAYTEAEVYDQNLLRGAKSIADKIDWGSIMIEVDDADRERLAELCRKGGFDMPDVKISIFKNRRGRWKNILLWCKAQRGICRIEPMFATKYNYELVEMEDFKIKIKKPQELSVF